VGREWGGTCVSGPSIRAHRIGASSAKPSVVLGADADEHARDAARQAVGRDAGVFECRPASLQQQALLRVDVLGFPVGDAEEARIELIDRVDDTGPESTGPRERGFLNLCLAREDLAEFEYRPRHAKRPYRMIVLRKTIVEERGQLCIGQDYRYFFYVTNDRTMTPEQVVREANDRCNQENLHAQLKGGVRALRAPLNTLEADRAYMVIVALEVRYGQLRVPRKLQQLLPDRHDADAAEHSLTSVDVPPSVSIT
jgi:hypothetical protein